MTPDEDARHNALGLHRSFERKKAVSRFARRKDRNHNDIVAALRAVGAVVKETYQFPGLLDGIAAFRGRIFWFDAKVGRADLTDAERELVEAFARAGVVLYIWRTPEQALRDIGAA